MDGKNLHSPRVAALVGPASSGKSSLLESLLLACGALTKKGTVKDHTTVSDLANDTKTRGVGSELAVASAEYLGEKWTFIDCPGAADFSQEAMHGALVADVVVVVIEPEPARAVAVSPMLALLDEHKIPHIVFINKVDLPGMAGKLRETISAVQELSARPIVLRELPIRDGLNITGFVDLVRERAYTYGVTAEALLKDVPEPALPEEHEARRVMLEQLADLDDHLLGELLEDIEPPNDEVFKNLTTDLEGDLIVEVFFGSAEKDYGVHRLMKALRHEAPGVVETAARLEFPSSHMAAVQSFKTVHALHVGKLSYVRVWRGELTDGATLGHDRVSGVYRLFGNKQQKVPKAMAGEIVALGHLDNLHTGKATTAGVAVNLAWVPPLQPMMAVALKASRPGDDVKLSSALSKLAEEDLGLRVEQSAEAHELVLWGQSDKHLKLAVERLRGRFGLELSAEPPHVQYRETIRKSVSEHGRFKHQSGGHGAFGDVQLDISPEPRGAGYTFAETVAGGRVPRQYFQSVDKGAREYFKRGPLGFPVVDIKVVLTDGTYHAVDSSDAAFQQAARVALTEAMPKAEPVLLEPIVSVQISTQSEATPRVQRIVTGRRGGQLLGYDRHPTQRGWDVVLATVPQAVLPELATELKAATQGVGWFTWEADRMGEVEPKEAERVVAARKAFLDHARG